LAQADLVQACGYITKTATFSDLKQWAMTMFFIESFAHLLYQVV